MITSSWLPRLDAADEAEVRQLLAECAEIDDDAGFPRPDLDPGRDAMHLLVRLERDRGSATGNSPATLAAYLRLTPGVGRTAVADYAVRPRLRSRGITTMLLERVGLDTGAPGGWADTGAYSISALATGNHPAADRIWRRFADHGVHRTRRSWQLIRPLRAGQAIGPSRADCPQVRVPGSDDAAALGRLRADLAARLPTGAQPLIAACGQSIEGAVWFDTRPSYATDFGPAVRIIAAEAADGQPGAETLATLLSAALEQMRAEGLRTAVIGIDAADEARARICRRLGFMHDRTDTEYTLC